MEVLGQGGSGVVDSLFIFASSVSWGLVFWFLLRNAVQFKINHFAEEE